MRIFGIEINWHKKTEDAIAVSAIRPTGHRPISSIPTVKVAPLSYAQQFARINRGVFFLAPEYDLAEIGKIEDSVSGCRFTAVKFDGELKTTTFEDLWIFLSNLYPVVTDGEKERIFLTDNRLQVLSGKVLPNLSEQEAKEQRICLANGCSGEYNSRGVCETHRGQRRLLGYVPSSVEGCWATCSTLIRHKVSKKGFRFLQKSGSTEVTCDHALLSLGETGELVPFKPEEALILAKITALSPEFGKSMSIDLALFTSYRVTEKEIIYHPLNNHTETKIPRYVDGNRLMDFMAVLGAFVAEGSTTKKQTVDEQCGFRIANNDIAWLEDLQKRFSRVFPGYYTSINLSSENKKKDKGYYLSCASSLISDLFANLGGKGAGNKKFPDFLYRLPLEAIKVFDDYLLDGDGHREPYGFSLTTKSLQLASQYSLLLRLRGINHTFGYRFNYSRVYYSVRSNSFFECYRESQTWLSPFEYKNEWVYDLEVPSTHNFVDLAGQILLHNTDSYVAWSFRKKEGLMFKEGVQARGRNKQTVQYYKTRMAQLAQASGIPTISLMKRVARSLIRTSNAYLVKVRSTRASGGQVRRTADGKTLQPVAAYFPAAPEMFKMDLDPESGKIRHWRQQLPNGWYKLFKPEDVIHFTFNKREGFSYGVPYMVPVVDDIRCLRQIEENVELLLYQHLFPLFQYKVGTETAPAGFTEEGRREEDIVREQVMLMPSEGMIVTPERHEITAIGAEGRAMNAEAYLTYFKKRVFAGLGMSAIDFGETDTSNKATAQTASRALVDSVKSFQDEFEAQWDQHVVRELLLESTFGDDVLEEENMVHLQFAEIDLDSKIKHEQHAAEIFKMNGITWDEFRSELGQEPVLVPDDPEDMDHTKWPEWFNTYWKLFEEPTHLIKAVDEPYLATQAAIHGRTIGVTSEMGNEAEKKNAAAVQAEAKAKAAAKPAPAPAKKKDAFEDSFLSESFDDLERDMCIRAQTSVEGRGRLDKDYLNSLSKTWTWSLLEKMNSAAVSSMIQGYNDQTGGMSYRGTESIVSGRKTIGDRMSRRLSSLAEDAVTLTVERVEKKLGDKLSVQSSADVAEQLHISFEAVRYRARFIWDVELRKSYNFGRLLGMQDTGAHGFKLVAHPDACEQCKAAHGRKVLAINADIDDVPPFHANSRMEYVPLTDEEAEDALRAIPMREPGSRAPAQDPEAEKISAICPKCGDTVIHQPTEGTFYCRKCRHSFQKIQDDLNVGGSGTVPSRKPKTPPIQQPLRAFAPSKRSCPRCGYTATLKQRRGFFKCSRCNYVFGPNETPAKPTGGKPLNYMPPKKRREQAELPAGTGGPEQLNSASPAEPLVNIDDGAKLERCIKSVSADLRKKNPGMSEDEIKSHAWPICQAQLKGK